MVRGFPKVSAKGLIRALLVVSLACLALMCGPLVIGWLFWGIRSALPTPNPWTWSGPLPRDISSPEGLPPELARMRIWWEGRYRYLDGTLVFPDLAQDRAWGNVSPSGRYSVRLTGGQTQIEWTDIASGEKRILAETGDFAGPLALGLPSFTPDEQAVVFDVAWRNAVHIAIVDVASGEITYIPLGQSMNSNPIVSPDGRWILVECESSLPRGLWGLCLIDWETHIRTFLTDDEGFDPQPLQAQFTPDSQWVVYPARYIGHLAWQHPPEGLRIYRVSIDGDEKHLLLSGLSERTNFAGVTSEDVVFNCSFPDQPTCDWICVIGLDGSDARRLTYLGESCPEPEDSAKP